ncbi:hypothetical protein E2C01_020484 [Portunus trituberculatus]|uniref:Uncharacterized protein n=1 Tax=Portunus trituberculatus TaxID=210409 RepID=A0A5B7E2E7_PORTR|nr:hypothetical protein [Portunus trituberculatus]
MTTTSTGPPGAPRNVTSLAKNSYITPLPPPASPEARTLAPLVTSDFYSQSHQGERVVRARGSLHQARLIQTVPRLASPCGLVQ